MAKKVTFYLIIATLMIGLLPTSSRALIIITNTQVSNFKNGTAEMTWTTDNPTKGTAYYGLAANQLDSWLSYGPYSYQHSLILTGLTKDKTYYYKIIVEGQDGSQTETYVQTFSTKGMTDTVAPNFVQIKLLQATGNAVALYWRTDEKSRATINYRPDNTEISKSTSYGNYDLEHVLFIYDLTPRKNYLAQIIAQDSTGNKNTDSVYFYTSDGIRDASNFTISDIQPASFDPSMIFSDTAIISWETSIAVRSSLTYGTRSGAYGKTLTASDIPNTEHKVIIAGLNPNTTYFYKIKTWGGIYNRNVDSSERSFTTIPVQSTVVPAQTSNNQSNSLVDSYKDSDNDGYPDSQEIKNSYNPYGYGRTLTTVANNIKKANTPENKQDQRLKKIVQQTLGKTKINSRLWLALINAATYGGYSDQAIIQAIKHKGKTVHATISAENWQNSSDYQNYINR
ncbi:MAG: fibronectin type III domain-containing protein [Patescibacteria group bacterium]